MATLGGVAAREEEPIGRHLPLRGDHTFELWVEAADEAELLAVIRAARAEKHTIRPVPPFTDALPPEAGLVGVAVRLGAGFERIEAHPEGLRVGASVPLAQVGLRTGYESLRGAPGVLADAWEEGWIAPMLARVRRFRSRGFEDVEDPAPDPRTLLVSAVLRPGVKVVAPRAGQAFRELKRRGVELRALLRMQGLSGLRLAGAMLANDDPAVLVNRGEGTPRQLRLLLQAARERVMTTTGLTLDDRLWPAGRGGRL